MPHLHPFFLLRGPCRERGPLSHLLTPGSEDPNVNFHQRVRASGPLPRRATGVAHPQRGPSLRPCAHGVWSLCLTAVGAAGEEAELPKAWGCPRPLRGGLWERTRDPRAVTRPSLSTTGASTTHSRTIAAGSASAATRPMPRTTPSSSPTTSLWPDATCGQTPCTRYPSPTRLLWAGCGALGGPGCGATACTRHPSCRAREVSRWLVRSRHLRVKRAWSRKAGGGAAGAGVCSHRLGGRARQQPAWAVGPPDKLLLIR